MKLSFDLNNTEETQDLGAKLLRSIAKKPCVIFLEGDLGSGKTSFAQGLIGALTTAPVLSPTYVYLHSYATTPKVYHFDLYRIKEPEALANLGLIDYLHDETAIRLIEWPACLKGLLEPDITINLEKIDSKRRATIEAFRMTFPIA
jgi:tRNA threonylcarbamoyladenosine biosynthesis protein TsaE